MEKANRTYYHNNILAFYGKYTYSDPCSTPNTPRPFVAAIEPSRRRCPTLRKPSTRLLSLSVLQTSMAEGRLCCMLTTSIIKSSMGSSCRLASSCLGAHKNAHDDQLQPAAFDERRLPHSHHARRRLHLVTHIRRRPLQTSRPKSSGQRRRWSRPRTRPRARRWPHSRLPSAGARDGSAKW